jgi:hypothetical protein
MWKVQKSIVGVAPKTWSDLFTFDNKVDARKVAKHQRRFFGKDCTVRVIGPNFEINRQRRCQ